MNLRSVCLFRMGGDQGGFFPLHTKGKLNIDIRLIPLAEGSSHHPVQIPGKETLITNTPESMS
jgi:hypothetical protein